MKEKRNYGIDALRLYAMFLIIIMHVVGRGGIIGNTSGKPYLISWFMVIFAYCAVNCYGIISGYVGFSETPRPYYYRKYILIWLQVFFYCCIIGILSHFDVLPGGEILTLKNIFLPVTSGVYWYFTAYTGVFFLVPWLNMFVRERSEREMNIFITIIFLIFSCYSSVAVCISDPFKMSKGYCFLWLLFLYLVGAWVKKCNIVHKIKNRYACIAIIIMVLMTWKMAMASPTAKSVLVSYISPFMVCNAVLYVSIFSNWNMSEIMKKVIKIFAPASFGVYLIHVHPIMWNLLENRFTWIGKFPTREIPFIICGCVSGIFISCLIIEKIRIIIFKILKISMIVDKISLKIIKVIKIKHTE